MIWWSECIAKSQVQTCKSVSPMVCPKYVKVFQHAGVMRLYLQQTKTNHYNKPSPTPSANQRNVRPTVAPSVAQTVQQPCDPLPPLRGLLTNALH